jgi:hypothetical protein
MKLVSLNVALFERNNAQLSDFIVSKLNTLKRVSAGMKFVPTPLSGGGSG